MYFFSIEEQDRRPIIGQALGGVVDNRGNNSAVKTQMEHGYSSHRASKKHVVFGVHGVCDEMGERSIALQTHYGIT